MLKVLPRLGVGGSEARIEAACLTPVIVGEADGVCAVARQVSREDATRREIMMGAVVERRELLLGKG